MPYNHSDFQFWFDMGNVKTKQSVDISSTPKKAGPDGDLNGKAVEAKVVVEETRIDLSRPHGF